MTPTSPPQISVVLPIFNSRQYVEQAIRSVLEQSFTDFELIAIDDGSKDGSGELVQQLANEDPRIRVLRQNRQGVTAALNTAVKACRAPLIARMDADDICMPDRFEKQSEFLKSNPHIIVVGGQTQHIDAQGRPLGNIPLPLEHEDIDTSHMLLHRIAISHPTAMIRTNALKRVGAYRPEFTAAQDRDLWLRLAEIGTLANLPDTVLYYRLHLESVGHINRATQSTLAWQAVEDARGRRGLPPHLGPKPVPASQATALGSYRKWGWWALKGGYVESARYYARKSLLHAPGSRESWRLLYCAYRGY